MSNETIVTSTWNVDYEPSQHRGRVLMTIARLRKLVGASTIELGDGSYRLVLPAPWSVLEPYAQGLDTRVQVSDLTKAAELDAELFKIKAVGRPMGTP